jgi:hypothetical protein
MNLKSIDKTIFLCVFFLLSFSASACLNTTQFRTFPVGISENKIIAIDFDIRRTSVEEGKFRAKLEIESKSPIDEMWFLKAYVSYYTFDQKLINKELVYATYQVGRSYMDSLKLAYNTGIMQITLRHEQLDLFKLSALSHCRFQKQCAYISIKTDTNQSKSFAIIDGKELPINFIADTSNLDFSSNSHIDGMLKGFYISSTRIYTCNEITLTAGHVQTGLEIANGSISENETDEESNEVFSTINDSSQKLDLTQEPLLHHGYGFDLFFVIRK